LARASSRRFAAGLRAGEFLVRTASRQRSPGSAAVELALVLPLALLLALALVQVGLLAKDSVVVVQAAREGAREATVTSDGERVRQAAFRGGGLPEKRTTVEIQRAGGVGDPVTVSVSYRAPMVVPFVDWLFPEEVTVEASATMRQETSGESADMDPPSA
jgi:Flp pilus assembly protein TadG